MNKTPTPVHSQSCVYSILMVAEWINTVETERTAKYIKHTAPRTNEENQVLHMKIWKDIERDYPRLAHVKEQEGIYGLRRLAIDIGTVIEEAFTRLNSEHQENLLHGSMVSFDGCIWRGVGDYDFEFVNLCCVRWMDIQNAAAALNHNKEVQVSADQMFDFILSLYPDWIQYDLRKKYA